MPRSIHAQMSRLVSLNSVSHITLPFAVLNHRSASHFQWRSKGFSLDRSRRMFTLGQLLLYKKHYAQLYCLTTKTVDNINTGNLQGHEVEYEP